jgi:hypothetical protein
MTAAFNLSQLANKVNSSGQLDASTGLVNALPAISGANLTNLNANNLASGTVPSARLTNGSVIQTVFGGSTTYTLTTSSSYIDATDCFLSITPSSTTSKILVNFSIAALTDAYDILGVNCDVQVVRGTTVVAATSLIGFGAVAGANMPLLGLDSPATTSAVTYKVQFRRTVTFGSTGNSVAINRFEGASVARSFFCLQEIKA